jgi:transposase
MSDVKIKSKKTNDEQLERINKYTAGIDIGSRSHFVAIPADLCDEPVREFSSFTGDLKNLAAWLKSHKIESIAMESTGVYWIPLFEMLENAGFEVILVNAAHVKNVPGRKSDVLDCQWIQRLHSYGLLRGAFRPDGETCVLRSFMRQRTHIIEEAASYKLRMQKALTQMNVHINNVISDLTGELGMKIVRAIVAGNHDPKSLANFHNNRYKNDKETIEKSLEGNYREEHIFNLKQSLEFMDFCHLKLKECDDEIEKIIKNLTSENTPSKVESQSKRSKQSKRRKNEFHFSAKDMLINLLGIDLTAVDGLEAQTVLKILSETGTDMSKWKTEKQFTSWLGLSPGTKISGGKKLSTRTRHGKNRASHYFKLSANTLAHSDSALGAFFRRMKAKLGTASAITATAHKLARIFYAMLQKKKSYADLGAEYYEQKHKQRVLKSLMKRAESLGYMLVDKLNMGVQNSLILSTV